LKLHKVWRAQIPIPKLPVASSPERNGALLVDLFFLFSYYIFFVSLFFFFLSFFSFSLPFILPRRPFLPSLLSPPLLPRSAVVQLSPHSCLLPLFASLTSPCELVQGLFVFFPKEIEKITEIMSKAVEAVVSGKKPELSGLQLYSRFAFAGAVCCGVTHGALTPVDV